ncbi:MAG: hypothetical protein KAH38_08225 [Candidatus Hydrogenedentes bacterium]|nr:hypothetical protein [Candidatus Hydrogenedentota bacterium]
MRSVCLSIALLLVIPAVSQGETTFEVTLTPPEAPYIHAVTYSIRITGDASLQCEFPDIPTDTKQIEIHRMPEESTPVTEDGIRITQPYQLDPIFPGLYKIPALIIPWESKDDKGTLTIPALVFRARELSPSEAEAAALFTGIAAPDTVLPPKRISKRGLFLFAGGSIAALIAIFLIVRHFLSKKKVSVILTPAWDIALNRLRELDHRNLPGTGKIDVYYVDLSAILRYYIEDHFHIHAPEQTTQEFLDTATQSKTFNEEHQQFLSDFLCQCDRVKFARLQPGIEDMTTHFKQVRHFIKDTMPKENEKTALEQAA